MAITIKEKKKKDKQISVRITHDLFEEVILSITEFKKKTGRKISLASIVESGFEQFIEEAKKL